MLLLTLRCHFSLLESLERKKSGSQVVGSKKHLKTGENCSKIKVKGLFTLKVPCSINVLVIINYKLF